MAQHPDIMMRGLALRLPVAAESSITLGSFGRVVATAWKCQARTSGGAQKHEISGLAGRATSRASPPYVATAGMVAAASAGSRPRRK